MHRLPSILLALLLAATQLPMQAAAQPVGASEAQAKPDNGAFLKKHEKILARARSGPIGLLFLGDSITERWQVAPQIWDRYYGQYQPANFGIGGDRTQNVIWRIENGELDGISPKVTVLMLGTNNSADDTAEEIAAADRKIVDMIRAKLPETKILILGIFPRGARHAQAAAASEAAVADAAKRMRTITAVNLELAKLDDGKRIRYLNINQVFLDADGNIPDAIMPDQLHPGPAGYQLWADAMQPTLEAMLK